MRVMATLFLVVSLFLTLPVTGFCEDALIIESLLQTPPPGYVIEKSFGNILVTQYVKWTAGFLDDVSAGINEAITKAEKKLTDHVTTKLGANAILAEKIDVQTLGESGRTHIIAIIQGEAVILKKITAK